MGNLSHSRKIVTGSDDALGASQMKELPSSVLEKKTAQVCGRKLYVVDPRRGPYVKE